MRVFYRENHVPRNVHKALSQMEEHDRILRLARQHLTLADIKDDPRSRRFAVSRIDPSRLAMPNFASPNPRQKFFNVQGTFVDPTNINQIPGKGSTPSSNNGTLSYTSTTTSITWTWTGIVIYRADGSTTSISNGSKAFTGLTAGTPYWFYPYVMETDLSVNFAGGANTAQSLAQGQVMNAQYNIPLSAGSMKVTTPASGTGGGSGGGGGNGCLHPSQKVWTGRGMVEADDLVKGDILFTPSGWQAIETLETEDCDDWIEVRLGDGALAWVTLSQPFYRLGTAVAPASELAPGDVLMAQYGEQTVESMRGFEEESFKVIIGLPEPHLFYLYEGGPLIHNGTVKP